MLDPDSVSSAAPTVHRLAPGADFLDACARLVIEASRPYLPDLSSMVVVLPNQHIAPGFRLALARAAGCAIWMPQLFTLTGLMREPLARIEKDSPAARNLRLYAALREQKIFPCAAQWQMAAELGSLFDELTERAAPLPDSVDELTRSLARGYRIVPDDALGFEAQFVHALWQADRQGLPSEAHALQQALSDYARGVSPGQPVFLMCDGVPSPTELRFIGMLAQRAPVEVFLPAREAAGDPVLASLAAAWPIGAGAPLADRARALREAHPGFSLRSRVQFMDLMSLENEAAAVAHVVREALEAGAKSIALIAADRVAARRARSALAAEGIEAEDETGWLLSTTRAAALIDALLEVVASNGYHRAVLDLVKAPFVCADWDAPVRADALLGLEHAMGRQGFVSGPAQLQRLAARHAPDALALVERLQAAFEALPGRMASVSDWVARLFAALDALGARAALESDPAGAEVLNLLEARAAELAGHGLRLDFNDWRDWLNREFERAMFRDEGLSSEVVMTHLAAARLRGFDLAVVVGADRAHLAAQSGNAIFATDSVRRELGLATRADARERLIEDLVLLIAGCQRVVFTRQAMHDGELNLPSPELEILDLVHEVAFGAGLAVAPHVEPVRGDGGGVSRAARPAPALEAEQVPGEVSASGYASLVACPYQYFARHVLRLAELDEVSETLEKSDYGSRVHDVLHRFHGGHTPLAPHDEAALVTALSGLTHEAFEADCRDNFLERAWLVRWLDRIPAYVAWALERERSGWVWVAGEHAARRELDLRDGARLAIKGRIDRIDRQAAAVSLLDYKTQGLSVLRRKVADADADVQLAFYGLLHDGAVHEAAYVALDDEEVSTVALPDVARAGAKHFTRIVDVFSAMRSGAPLPAHGAAVDCDFCEMQGVCRKHYHVDESSRA